MKDSIRRKLERLAERFEEISRLLSDAGVIARQNQFRELSMEYARLGPLVERYRRFAALEAMRQLRKKWPRTPILQPGDSVRRSWRT